MRSATVARARCMAPTWALPTVLVFLWGWTLPQTSALRFELEFLRPSVCEYDVATAQAVVDLALDELEDIDFTKDVNVWLGLFEACLLYTSPSPRDRG